MIVLIYLSAIVMIISALYAVYAKDLLVSVVALGINSLIVSVLFF